MSDARTEGDYSCPSCGESHANPRSEDLGCGEVCNRVTCPYCGNTETFHETGCAESMALRYRNPPTYYGVEAAPGMERGRDE